MGVCCVHYMRHYLLDLSLCVLCLFSNPIKRIPLLGGKELDLYHLYEKVQSLGGSEKVIHENIG